MIIELISVTTSGLILAVASAFAFKILTSLWARTSFRRKSRGLPMVSGARLLGNHAYHMFLGDRVCENLREDHQERGKTLGWLRGTQLCVSTVDLDLIKTIILDEPDKHLERTSLNIPVAELEFCIATAPEAEWRQLRRAIAPALTSIKFKTANVQLEIEDSIDKLIGLIERRLDAAGPEQVFVVDDFVARYSAQLVARCFYKQDKWIDFESERDKYTHALELIVKMFKSNLVVYLTAIFPSIRGLIDWLANEFTLIGLARRLVRKFVAKQTRLSFEARRQLLGLKRSAQERGVEFDADNFTLRDGTRFRRNMSDHLIDQLLDGHITTEQYVNNSVFSLGAGFRTAADCLVHAIYLISVHRECQERLRASIIGQGVESDYLDWVLRESLRLLPPAPIGCSRTVSRDIELASGYVVPKGTFVLANAYVIHRQKEYWGEDADEFRPERWRDTSHHHPMQFQAFGAGIKGCPGRQFAMHEMKMLLVALLTRYNFSGEFREDVYEFDTPLFMYVLPNSVSEVKINRLAPGAAA